MDLGITARLISDRWLMQYEAQNKVQTTLVGGKWIFFAASNAFQKLSKKLEELARYFIGIS